LERRRFGRNVHRSQLFLGDTFLRFRSGPAVHLPTLGAMVDCTLTCASRRLGFASSVVSVVTRPRGHVSQSCASFATDQARRACLSCALGVVHRKASCVRVLGPVYFINWINFFFFGKLNTMTRSSPAGSPKKNCEQQLETSTMALFDVET
jgi:hypothetical protein